MEEGFFKIQMVDDVFKELVFLVVGFEWVIVDLKSDEEVKEVYEFLNGYYVEDDDVYFCFNYLFLIFWW